MEKHCCSLELSKKLAEAGWKKDTEFWWIKEDGTFGDGVSYHIESRREIAPREQDLPAPLATEILEELPDEIKRDGSIFLFYIYKDNRGFIVGYGGRETTGGVYCNDMPYIEKNICNAFAEMWCYLKKEVATADDNHTNKFIM